MIDTDVELKAFSNRLQKLNEGITIMKEFGLNEDILEAYLCHNLKMSKKEAVRVMDCCEDFYDKIVKAITIKKLKENK